MPRVALTYWPYEDLQDRPNVIVDGTGTPTTTLTLSHWPGSPAVAPDLQADLSAEMAFRYLDHPHDLHGDATVASNNHFDQDGLVSLFALCHPAVAQERRSLLEDLAGAGDFATFRDRTAARASMVVSAFTDPARSPMAPLPDDYSDMTAHLYSEALVRLPELVDNIDQYHHLWKDEDAQLADCERALEDGAIRIDERDDADLAVVTVSGATRWSGHRFGGRRYEGVHPMVVHNATACSAVLLIAGSSYKLTHRYETWVQYRSRQLPRRADMTDLAHELSALDDVAWSADPIDQLTPELQPDGGSSLDPNVVIEAIVRHLRTAPPAFDPFAERTDAR